MARNRRRKSANRARRRSNNRRGYGKTNVLRKNGSLRVIWQIVIGLVIGRVLVGVWTKIVKPKIGNVGKDTKGKVVGGLIGADVGSKIGGKVSEMLNNVG